MTSAIMETVVPKVTRLRVTPAQAMNWLEHANNRNRNISDQVVKRYARDMKAGHWRLTHQGIAFDPSGVLIDGQHRLWAIVESDTPVEMFIWFNISPEALMAIDSGRARSLVDNLRLGGGVGGIGPDVMATLRAIVGHGISVAMTADEAKVALERHRDAVDFAIEHLGKCGVRGVVTAEVRAVVARAWYSVDLAHLDRFCEVLRTSVASDEAARTVIALRNFLSARCGSDHATRLERYAKTERALLAFLRDEPPIVRLYAAASELFPLPGEC
jgi:hypothetical protein